MSLTNNYTPIKGFYDLNEFDIPKKEFQKLWNIQKYLFKCEQNRIKGLYKSMKLELEKVKNLSAEYQQTLFSYKTKNQTTYKLLKETENEKSEN